MRQLRINNGNECPLGSCPVLANSSSKYMVSWTEQLNGSVYDSVTNAAPRRLAAAQGRCKDTKMEHKEKVELLLQQADGKEGSRRR